VTNCRLNILKNWEKRSVWAQNAPRCWLVAKRLADHWHARRASPFTLRACLPGITAYAWAILNTGTTGATITSATNAESVVVSPTAAGTFLVQLATTDNTGFVSTATLDVAVRAPVVVTPPAAAPPAPTSSGGGGALGVGWLLLLLAAVLSLALASARERAARSLSAAGRRG